MWSVILICIYFNVFFETGELVLRKNLMAFRKRTMMPSVFVSFFKLIYIFYLVEGHIWRPTMLCQLLLVQLPWCSREGVKAIRRGSRMEERGSAECEDVFGRERGQVLDWCRASGWGKLCRCEIVLNVMTYSHTSSATLTFNLDLRWPRQWHGNIRKSYFQRYDKQVPESRAVSIKN